MRLTCTSNIELRIDDDAGQLLRQPRQRELVAALHVVEPLEQRRVVGEQLELAQLVEIADPAVADRAS